MKLSCKFTFSFQNYSNSNFIFYFQNYSELLFSLKVNNMWNSNKLIEFENMVESLEKKSVKYLLGFHLSFSKYCESSIFHKRFWSAKGLLEISSSNISFPIWTSECSILYWLAIVWKPLLILLCYNIYFFTFLMLPLVSFVSGLFIYGCKCILHEFERLGTIMSTFTGFRVSFLWNCLLYYHNII